ncbi:MAG: RNA polymerase sigma-70 factor [Bacteroidota bacterium]
MALPVRMTSPDASPTDPLLQWSERLTRSDRTAFKRLFEALHEPLVRYAVPLAGDTAAAHDIVQEAFIKLWQRRAQLDPNRSVKALLYTIVRNLSLNERRNRTSRAEKLEAAAVSPLSPTTAEQLDAEALQRRLRGWMKELPDRQREALLLSRYEGLSHEEVAQVMEVSPRTVNNHIVRALRTLRDRLQAFDPGLLAHESTSP